MIPFGIKLVYSSSRSFGYLRVLGPHVYSTVGLDDYIFVLVLACAYQIAHPSCVDQLHLLFGYMVGLAW